MGISGLLPALKPIQVTKHLSEYSGKTIAVDAYVWLHKGVYSCATELATGKNTHKYVDYAMHRVRLLRHHRIVPYIVFDGGPLPAKKGTESERKQRREENLTRGKALVAQGKHSQARECFIKCVDVTPQMAFQFIKALRAEAVSYVVAPYEADAQLAYLERVGVVDGILTEDSDLLVFGCKTVLFKLDPVASTVISISRKDFGSVTASSSDPNGISLVGWSDVQFRAMSILSGCDYLPSIPGVGLKTACTLLRKWRTAEQVVRAISLEGKKSVPLGYWKQFQLAEKCFLHQRVYCPRAEKLVHLTDVSDDWTAEFDTYVGSDMEQSLAQRIARGDVDPTTFLPMTDINRSFVPRALKPLVMVPNSPSKSSNVKGKMREPHKSGGILSFFGPNPIIPPRQKQKSPVAIKPHGLAGKASGKRTLAEVMDYDIERKKKTKTRKSSSPLRSGQSKFFFQVASRSGSVQRRHSDILPIAGPSRLQNGDKENRYIVVDDEEAEEAETSEPDLDGSELSLKAQFGADVSMEDVNAEDSPDVVEQEDGYISPSPSCSKDAQDLSSPLLSPRPQNHDDDLEMAPNGIITSDTEDEASFGAEAISSPISVRRPSNHRREAYQTPSRRRNGGPEQPVNILVGATPTPSKPTQGIYPDLDEVPSPTLYRGPDLRSMLGDDTSTELDVDERPNKIGSGSSSASPPSPSPETPNPASEQTPKVAIGIDNFEDLTDDEERTVREISARANTVMNGWRDRWALPSNKTSVQRPAVVATKKASPQRLAGVSPTKRKKPFTLGARPAHAFNLRRNETNVTPAGRHSLAHSSKHPRSAPAKFVVEGAVKSNSPVMRNAVKPKRSFLLFETVNRTATTSTTSRERQVVDLTVDKVDLLSSASLKNSRPGRLESEMTSVAQARFAQFRCP